MKLEVLRFSSQNNSTLGMLFDVTKGRKFLCFTLEDEFREVKISGETRIPAGTYNVTLRTEGGFNQRYDDKFGTDFNKGMLWVRDVPGFEYILIHNNHFQMAVKLKYSLISEIVCLQSIARKYHLFKMNYWFMLQIKLKLSLL